MNYSTRDIFVCDNGMNAVDSFPAPAIHGGGVAIGRSTRGRTLWCTSYYTNRIYEIDDEYHNPVEESSWGRIKDTHR